MSIVEIAKWVKARLVELELSEVQFRYQVLLVENPLLWILSCSYKCKRNLSVLNLYVMTSSILFRKSTADSKSNIIEIRMYLRTKDFAN